MLSPTTAIAEAKKTAAFALHDFVAFMSHPRLDQSLVVSGTISRSALSFWLLVFSFAVTAIFALLALPLIIFSSASPGDNLRDVLGQPAVSVLITLVILGPLVEEMMFRGWLPGTFRSIAGCAAFLAIIFGGSFLARYFIPHQPVIGTQVGVAALGLLAFLAIQREEVGVHPAWYERVFPIVFWSQGIVFGCLHFANLATNSLILSILAVLPLIICGWLWGYARIALGFGAAWMLHMAYNVPAALAALAMLALRQS